MKTYYIEFNSRRHGNVETIEVKALTEADAINLALIEIDGALDYDTVEAHEDGGEE